MLKKFTLICAVLAFCVSAQYYPHNARIESLAKTFIIDDINDVLRYPAYMKNYQNDLQVTFVSPIIGIKSVDDKFSLGVIANRGLMLTQEYTNNFYATAMAQFTVLEAAAPGSNLPDISITNQWIPHALLLVDVGAISLGFDVFMEYARSRYSIEPSGNDSISGSAAIYNPGVIASALFGNDNLPIAVKLGIAMPKIKGHYENQSREIELKSDKGVYLEFGGEAGIPVGALTLDLGADFIMEKYSFEAEDTAKLFSSDEFSTVRTAVYAGLEGNVFTNGLWGAQYTLNYLSGKDEITNKNWNRVTRVVHTISCGLENGWDSVWIFDNIYARGGMRIDLNTPYASSEQSKVEVNAKGQTTFNQVVPTVGFGIKKGIFELDLNINLGDWDNLVTGPAVAKVTAGLRF